MPSLTDDWNAAHHTGTLPPRRQMDYLAYRILYEALGDIAGTGEVTAHSEEQLKVAGTLRPTGELRQTKEKPDESP